MTTTNQRRIAQLESELAAAKSSNAAPGRINNLQNWLDDAKAKERGEQTKADRVFEVERIEREKGYDVLMPSSNFKSNAVKTDDTDETKVKERSKLDNSAKLASKEFRSKVLASNVLNDYEQVAYHVEWFFCPEQEVKKYLREEKVKNKRKHLKNRVVIVESGVTSQFGLTSLEFETICGVGDQNRGIQTTKIKMEMFESKGLSFFDKLLELGASLGINRITNYPSFLRVTWNGYTSDGVPVDTIGDFDFIWPVTLTNIKPEVDVLGTTYSIEMYQTKNEAMDPSVIKMQENIEFKAKNLKEFFANLETKLNERTFNMQGYWLWFMEDIKALEGHPKINKFIKIDSSKLESQLLELTKDANGKFITGVDQSTIGSFNEEKKFTMTPDQDLRTIVNAALIEVVKGLNTVEIDETVVKFNHLVGSSTSTEYGVFIEETQEYPKSHTFKLYLTSVSRMIEAITGNKTETESKVFDSIVEANHLKKLYTYNFSGTNVDVLSLDVNFDALWAVTVSSNTFIAEERKSNTQDAPVKRVVDITEEEIKKLGIRDKFRLRQAQMQEAEDSFFGRVFNDISTTDDAILASVPELEAAAAERKKKDLATKFSEGRILLETRKPTENKKSSKKANNSPVTSPRSSVSWDKDIEQFTITPIDAVDLKSRERANVVEQTFNDAKGTFLTLDMEIRGDPYWIGNPESTSFEEQTIDDNLVAKYSQGEHSFIFEYQTPKDINELTGLVETESGHLLKGVYNVQTVTHTFAEGKFTQKLRAVRNTNVKF